MNVIIFYLLAGIILFFAVLSVTTRKILRAATYLLFVLIATAGIYFLLDVYFLAGVQLMLYAGGIVVLIVFSVLLTSKIDHQFEKTELKKLILTGLGAAAGAAICLVTVLDNEFLPIIEKPLTPSIHQFGLSLLSYGAYGYVLPFEVISILLLAAMVAAIMVAKRK